jgi:hypothetical protein
MKTKKQKPKVEPQKIIWALFCRAAGTMQFFSTKKEAVDNKVPGLAGPFKYLLGKD